MKNKKYKINEKEFNRIISIISIIISLISLYITILVRNDTAELSKFNDKPIYYTISLYPNENTKNATIKEKYLNIDLSLVVDDFKVKKKNFLDVNYNSVFTKIKYYFVYDYELDNNIYKYMSYSLDDKSEAKMRFEDKYVVIPTKLNYSFTPNKTYAYILVYTETTNNKNLDLIFFNYYDKDNTFTLDTIKENNKDKIDIKRIDYNTYICKYYFVDLWTKEEHSNEYDIEYMFKVYNDLKDKLINNN